MAYIKYKIILFWSSIFSIAAPSTVPIIIKMLTSRWVVHRCESFSKKIKNDDASHQLKNLFQLSSHIESFSSCYFKRTHYFNIFLSVWVATLKHKHLLLNDRSFLVFFFFYFSLGLFCIGIESEIKCNPMMASLSRWLKFVYITSQTPKKTSTL